MFSHWFSDYTLQHLLTRRLATEECPPSVVRINWAAGGSALPGPVSDLSNQSH